MYLCVCVCVWESDTHRKEGENGYRETEEGQGRFRVGDTGGGSGTYHQLWGNKKYGDIKHIIGHNRCFI